MKKLVKKISFIALTIVLVFSVSLFLKGNLKKEETVLNPDVLGLPDSINSSEVDISFKENIYRVNWYEIGNIDNLSLSVNLNKLTSKEFLDQEKCLFLSSGGYYKSNYSPTGYFISEYEEVSPFVISSLADGIFSVNDFATPRITSQVPRDRLRMALQAGPLLKENGNFINLSLRNDEEARRVVLGVTGDNKAIFLIVYNSGSAYAGPFLKDLPQILNLFESETGIVFADAMNLDGGTPTVFNDNKINLPEATIVGSFFCLK
jgi:hypothetical protein